MKYLSVKSLYLCIYDEQRTVEPTVYIDSIEAKIGVVLPEVYRKFLFSCQTARSCIARGFATFRYRDDSEGSIEEFFGQSDFMNDHLFYLKNTQGRLHPHLLPIGADGLGNLTCLGVKEDARGKIFFWEPLGLPGENVQTDHRTTHLVANSFCAFIEKIEIEEDDDEDEV